MKNHEDSSQGDPTTARLELEIGDFKMPISFKARGDDTFSIGGVQPETSREATITGNMRAGVAIINHIYLDDELRSKGVAKALLVALEEQLKKLGSQKIFATFKRSGTVEFFLHHGYKIHPAKSLLDIDDLHITADDLDDFDEMVNNETDFQTFKSREGVEYKKILLLKEGG